VDFSITPNPIPGAIPTQYCLYPTNEVSGRRCGEKTYWVDNVEEGKVGPCRLIQKLISDCWERQGSVPSMGF
jgi:hypothetical protein